MKEKSTIKDIFHGFRGNMESMQTPKQINVNANIICDTYDELKQKLSPELLNLHQKLVDALEEDWLNQIDFYFTEGFKLGLNIGFECIDE